MGTHFRVAELARLYGLNSDTLRYYEEQGLLHPRRGENRYREYSIADLCDLNIIRSLRELDVPVGEIRGYLHDRTAAATAEMLRRQQSIIREKIAALREEERAVRRRMGRLEAALAMPVGEPALVELPARRCILHREKGIPEADVDYLLKKLEHSHAGLLKDLGSRPMGAVIDPASLASGRCDRYGAVFFLCGAGDRATDSLPAGRYASIVHAGGYDAIAGSYRRLLSFVAEQGLAAEQTPIELYRLDVHDTGVVAEYRTEIQVLVGGQG